MPNGKGPDKSEGVRPMQDIQRDLLHPLTLEWHPTRSDATLNEDRVEGAPVAVVSSEYAHVLRAAPDMLRVLCDLLAAVEEDYGIKERHVPLIDRAEEIIEQAECCHE